MPSAHPSCWTAWGYLLLTAALAAGCATAAPSPSVLLPSSQAAEPVAPPPEYVPVVRYGRYTLVELTPTAAQRDLLLQEIDVAMPDTLAASVGDALRYVLLRSGYQLCHGRETDALDVLRLPAAHYRLGPLVLRDALQTLVGSAWELHVDDAMRGVCFTRAGVPDVQPDTPQPPTLPEANAEVETVSIAEGDQP